MDTGLVHRVVCPFTPQLALVLINRSRRDGTLSWHCYTAAVGEVRIHNLTVASSARYHMATAYHIIINIIVSFDNDLYSEYFDV